MCPVVLARGGRRSTRRPGGFAILPAVAQLIPFLVDYRPISMRRCTPRIIATGDGRATVDP
jgi:hypothetical protein